MPALLKVISMNASGSNAGPNVDTDRPEGRRQCIKKTVDNKSPAIVFFQEFGWQDVRGELWDNNALPNQYHYFRRDNASIMVNTNVCPLDTSRDILMTDLEAAKNYAANQCLALRPNPYGLMITEENRYAIKILKIEEADLEVICMSWHGPHKFNEDKKIIYFQNLMFFIQEIRRRHHKLPMIVGGDFNISRNLVKNFVPKPFNIVRYKPSRRRRANVIDFFLMTEIFDIVNAGWLYLNLLPEQRVILDHDPIHISIPLSGTCIPDEYLEDVERLFSVG